MEFPRFRGHLDLPHHSPADVALLATLSEVSIHVPGHPEEAEALLRSAARADDVQYLRLSTHSNAEPYAEQAHRPLRRLRTGTDGVVIVCGPLADAAMQATEGLVITVLYTHTIRPFPATELRAALPQHCTPAIVLIEPYLTDTSTACVNGAFRDVPHRVLGLGVARAELRNYGAPLQHTIAHGLDPAGLRRSIDAFLRPGAAPPGL